LGLDGLAGQTRRGGAAAMSAHAVGDDEQASAGMAAALFARRGVGAEVLVFGTDQSHVGAQNCLNPETRHRDGRFFRRG